MDFFLDCDEICSLELKEKIQKALAHNSPVSAYQVSRLTWYYDRFLRHGGMYPDRLFRLFKPEAIEISQKNGHPVYIPTKEHGILDGDLLHYSYESFRHQMQKINGYATRGANSMRAEGKKEGLQKRFSTPFGVFSPCTLSKKAF